jgi:hypothetical protein
MADASAIDSNFWCHGKAMAMRKTPGLTKMMFMLQVSSENFIKNTQEPLVIFTPFGLANFLFTQLMKSLHLEGGVM